MRLGSLGTVQSFLFHCNYSQFSVGMKQNEAWVFGNGTVFSFSMSLVSVNFGLVFDITFGPTFERSKQKPCKNISEIYQNALNPWTRVSLNGPLHPEVSLSASLVCASPNTSTSLMQSRT